MSRTAAGKSNVMQGKYWAVVMALNKESNFQNLSNGCMVVKTTSFHCTSHGSIPQRSKISFHFLSRNWRLRATRRVGHQVMCR